MPWDDTARNQHSRDGLRHPSDLTDRELSLIEPLLPSAKSGGRPRTTDLRAVTDAMHYIEISCCQWRMLPKDFPPVSTVRGYFYAWRNAGLWQTIILNLRRLMGGRHLLDRPVRIAGLCLVPGLAIRSPSERVIVGAGADRCNRMSIGSLFLRGFQVNHNSAPFTLMVGHHGLWSTYRRIADARPRMSVHRRHPDRNPRHCTVVNRAYGRAALCIKGLEICGVVAEEMKFEFGL